MRFKLLTALAVAVIAAGCAQSTKSGLNPKDFKAERDGSKTGLYTLTNTSGMEVCITNFGGRIVSVMVPDKNGEFKDVVLGFDKVSDYFPENNQTDFGATIGRYANRIDHGRFTLDSTEYQLPQNNYGHCLHGGPEGWQYKVYDVLEADASHLKLGMDSPAGDSGFPGEVKASVTFTLTEDNSIDIRYEATTDAPTVINMTNHSYFNLSGDPAGHQVTEDSLFVYASFYTPIDSTFMTTGEIAPVDSTSFDFRRTHKIGEDIDADNEQIRYGHGFDHNWVLDTRGYDTVLAVELHCAQTGIVLKEYTDEPGIQIYSGNFLDGSVIGKNGVAYGPRTAICLESQKFPDTPNKPEWPSAVLRPGETYTSHCVYAFSVR